MKLTILGQVPPKKNSRNIFVRNGRIVNVPSERHTQWERDALVQLRSSAKGSADNKVTIAYQFFVKDNGRRDLDNMIASINDVLVKSGLLIDDDWQHLAIGGADAQVDKKNPRVVLFIEED